MIAGYGHFLGFSSGDLIETWDSMREQIVQNHLSLLMQCLNQGTERMRTVSCNILNYCTAGSSRVSEKDAVVEAGGIDGLISALKGSVPHPAANAANAIATMMYNHQNSQAKFLAAGLSKVCIEIVLILITPNIVLIVLIMSKVCIEMLQTEHEIMFEKCVWILKSLVWSIPQNHASAVQSQKMVELGVCEPLVRCLAGKLGRISQHAGCIGQCSDLVTDLLNQTGEAIACTLVGSGLVPVMLDNLDCVKNEFKRCKTHPVSQMEVLYRQAVSSKLCVMDVPTPGGIVRYASYYSQN